MFEGFTTTDIDTSSFDGARIHLRHGGDGPPLLCVQRVGRQLADHRHAVIDGLGLESEPACHLTEQAAGNARAGWVPRERPRDTCARLHHPQPVIHIDASGPSRRRAVRAPVVSTAGSPFRMIPNL